ncbi:MAG: hypothetical protein SGJ19_18700 [Planctomycetia bacterium]|nr:hypothetical protein [Planctomycetia bacterium]
MTFQGIVQNGQIIIAGDRPLPEGAAVDVHVAGPSIPFSSSGTSCEPHGGSVAPSAQIEGNQECADSDSASPIAKMLPSLIGCIDDLPEDFAERHDHYLHGRDCV